MQSMLLQTLQEDRGQPLATPSGVSRTTSTGVSHYSWPKSIPKVYIKLEQVTFCLWECLEFSLVWNRVTFCRWECLEFSLVWNKVTICLWVSWVCFVWNKVTFCLCGSLEMFWNNVASLGLGLDQGNVFHCEYGLSTALAKYTKNTILISQWQRSCFGYNCT